MHRRPHDRLGSGASNGGGASSRLPIFHDDLSFNDRRGRSLFDDFQRQMDEDFGNMRLGSGLSGRRNKWGADWDDEPDRLFKDFFELRPRNPKLGKISREDASSRESLDDSTTKSLFIEDPQSKQRLFQISFNVQEYAPEDITVKVVEDTLLVEAKHEDDKGGNKSTREFSRKIAIPKEVDPDKLSSTMSNDGILTIKAPVPPMYQSIAGASSGSPTPSSSSFVPAVNYTDGKSANTSYAPHPSTLTTTYPPPYNPLPAPVPTYQGGATSYPATYPAAPPPPAAGYYAPPPTQPRMSAPVPQMQPQMGPQSPTLPQAQTMTSGALPHPHAMYYQQQPMHHQGYPVTSPQDFPPPPPPQAFPSPPLSLAQDFPMPPPPAQANQPPVSAAGPAMPTLDTPTYTDTSTGRRMDLALFLGPPYTPEDILVKVDGKTLIIEANHSEKKDNKTSKASMSREFELAEDINPQTVQANLTNDGHLKLAAMVPLPSDVVDEPAEQPVATTAQE